MRKPLYFCALVTVFSGAALAQNNFVLDIVEGSNFALQPGQTTIPVQVTYNGASGANGADAAAAKTIKIIASRFTSDQEFVQVTILKTCQDKVGTNPETLEFKDSPTMSLCLSIPQLNTDGKYSGSLSILADNKKFETKFTISGPPATLVIDRSTLTAEMDRPFYAPASTWLSEWIPWFSSFDPFLGSVVLDVKSGKVDANGIGVQSDSTLKAPGTFDPLTNLTFDWPGKPGDQPSPSAVEPFAPGAPIKIAVSGKNLKPGEYIVPIHFTARGANTDNAKFTMTIHIRDSVVFAIAALVIALFLSFVITKMLTGKRRRIAFLQQIQELRVSKGTNLPRLPAVVWVDAVLNLAERLSSRFWLSGADIIDAHVNSVRSTVEILKQVRELRAGLEPHLPKLIYDRAVEAIDRIVSELGAETPDDALVARIKAELAAFNDWLQAATYPAALSKLIQPALQKLQRDIQAGAIPDNVKTAIDPLKAALDKALDAALANPPQSAYAVEESYRQYARLRILWDCRMENDLFAKLTSQPEPDLEECFRLDDNLAWERLRAGAAGLKIKFPQSGDGLEAFKPLSFSVVADDPKIGHSYVFSRKVQYAWQFTLETGPASSPENRNEKNPNDVILTPTTIGPTVVQYFPRKGTVKAAVTLSYSGPPISIVAAEGLPTTDSGDFGILDAFEGVEYISWAIAGVVALATGLATYYYKNPTFGSFQDYLTLIMWGAGMDQGKNFLQALQSVSGQPAGSPSQH